MNTPFDWSTTRSLPGQPSVVYVRNTDTGTWFPISRQEAVAPKAAAPSEAPNDSRNIGDYGKSVMAGFAGLGATVGWAVKHAPLMEKFGSAIETVGNDAVDYWNDSLSTEAKQDLAKQFVQKNEDGEYEWGDANLNTLGLSAAQSAPSMLGGMGVGAGLTKVLRVFANPIGRAALEKTIQAGSGAAEGTAAAARAAAALKKLKMVDSVMGAAGFGAGEGAIAGGDAGRQVEKQVNELPLEQLAGTERWKEVYDSADDMPEDARIAYATSTIAREAGTQAGWQSGLTTFLLGGGAGAFYGKLLNRTAMTKLAGYASKLESTVAGRALKGAMVEGSQEFAQSGAQQLVQNKAANDAGADVDPFHDVFEQAVGGMAVGAPMGGAFSAFEGQDPQPQEHKAPGKAEIKAASLEVRDLLGEARKRGVDPKVMKDVIGGIVNGQTSSIQARDKLREILGMPPAEPFAETDPYDDVLNAAQEGTQEPLRLTGPQAAPDFTVDSGGLARAPGQELPALPAPRGSGTFEVDEAGNAREVTQGEQGLAQARSNALDADYADAQEELATTGFAQTGTNPGRSDRGPRALPAPRATSVLEVGADGTARPQSEGTQGKNKADADEQRAQAEELQRRRLELGQQEPRTDREAAAENSSTSGNQKNQAVATAAAGPGENKSTPKLKFKVALGNIDEASHERGGKVETQYAVAELGDLVASNDHQTGLRNRKFPKALQPRDRSPKSIRDQQRTAAERFDPDSLLAGGKTGSGAPIVGADGLVESGNGRVMQIRAIAQAGGMGPYTEKLKARAAELGIDPAHVDAFQQPVLIRVRSQEMDETGRKEFTQRANELPAEEQAKADRRNEILEAAKGVSSTHQVGGTTTIDPNTQHEGTRAEMDRMREKNRTTSWIQDEAWRDRPVDVSAEEATAALEKAQRGEALGPRQQAWVDYIEPIFTQRQADNEAAQKDADKRQARSKGEVADDETDLEGEALSLENDQLLASLTAEELDAFDAMAQKLYDETESEIDRVARRETEGEPEEAAAAGKARGSEAPAEGEREAPQRAGSELELEQQPAPKPAAVPPKPASSDLFGTTPVSQQAIADAKRKKDADRNSGQDSPETGDAADLFSKARRQTDLTDVAAGTRTKPAAKIPDDAPALSEKKPAGSPKNKIEDFGEKIDGARKDYAATMSDALTRDVAKEPLSKTWPEPDYVKFLADGMDAWTVGFIRVARDSIPTRPQRAYKLQRWVQQVTTLRQFSIDLAAGKYTAPQLIMKMPEERWAEDLLDNIELYKALGHERSLKGYSLKRHSWSFLNGAKYNPPKVQWAVEGKSTSTWAGNMPRELGTGDTKDAAIAAFKKTLEGTTPAEAKKRIVRFDIYSDRETKSVFIGKKIGRNVVRMKEFGSVAEARAWKDAHGDELVKMLEEAKDLPSERRDSNAPRVGIDHRNGADITPEQFAEAFGFRGVQFGNWVEGDRRQTDLNEAHDALMDLAGIIGVSPRALSLNGELGLAFGARGKGGKQAAAAHYESTHVVINLTKMAGKGALAHEWFHAADNYFARAAGKPHGFVTDPARGGAAQRPELQLKFRGLMAAINRLGMKKRALKMDELRDKPYWSTDLEMAARAFESYVVAKLQDQNGSNDYLANIVNVEEWTQKTQRNVLQAGTYPYPVTAEMPTIRAQFDALFDEIEEEAHDERVRLFSKGEGEQATPSGSAGVAADWLRTAGAALDGVANVQVVDTMQQLRELLGDPQIDEATEGVYEGADGSVYFVAENLQDLDRAREVFVHEVFGHLAMERSPDLAKALRMVQSMRDLKLRSTVSLWNEVGRSHPGLSPTNHAKEVVALMAERGIRNSVTDRVIAWARDLLRKLGVVKKYSEADLRALIAGAGRKLVRDAAASTKLSATDRAAVTGTAAALQEVTAAEDGMDAAGLRLASQRAGETLGDLAPKTAAEDPQPASIDRLYSKRAPMSDRAEAARKKVFAEAAAEDMSAKDKLREGVQKIKDLDGLAAKQGIFDFAASIESYEKALNGGKLLDASKSAYKQVLSTQNLASVMGSVMQSGVPVWKNGVYAVQQGRKGLAAIFAPLTANPAGNLVSHFELYAAARRSSRLINETNPDGTSKEKLLTREDIAAGLELGKQYPELAAVFNEWQTFNGQALDMMQEAGLIDAESRKLWERNDYVPFYRAMEDMAGVEGPGKKGGITGQRSGVHTLTGRDAQLGNIIENMMLNVAHSVDASFKNRAATAVADMLDGVAMTKLPLDWQPVEVTNAQMAGALRKAGIEFDMAATPAQKAAYSTLFRRVAPAGPNIVTVMRAGKPEYYEVADPLLLRSLTAMGGNPVIRQLDIFGLVSGAKRVLTHAVTAHPHFIIANFIRDTLATWVQSPLKIGVLTGAFKGFRDVMKNDPDYQAIMAAGGGGGSVYDTDPKSIRTLLARKLPENQLNGFLSTIVSPKKMWAFYRQVQVAAENANRLRIYRATKANGGSDAEAAYQARDVLNFTMRGDHVAVQALAMSVPFLNARLQGLYRLQRGYKQNRAAFLQRGMMLMAATLALMFVNHDDERYEELQEWDRDTYWHVFLGEQHWRIPKPFEVGSLFGTMPERAVRLMLGQDNTRVVAQSMMAMVTNTFAFNPVPQLVRPAYEQYQNKLFFTGQPIVGRSLEGLKPEAQASENTSATLIEIARAMPESAPEWLRSPVRLEALVRGYLGSMGMAGVAMADTMTRAGLGYPDAPAQDWTEIAFSRFLRAGEPRSTKYTEELYRMSQEANEAAKTINSYRKKGRDDDARAAGLEYKDQLKARGRLNKLVANMRKLNDQAGQVMQSKNLDPVQKRARIEQINSRRNEIARLSASFADYF